MTIDKDLGILEQHVEALKKAASNKVSAEKMREGVDILVRLASKVQADQSANNTYYGLGSADAHEASAPTPDVTTVTDVAEVKVAQGTTRLAYDTYKANSELADGILDTMEVTNSRIDELVTAGKRFNATQAKADLHEVTSKVAGIVNDVDLTAPWVGADLGKLAARAQHLHGLFFPKK